MTKHFHFHLLPCSSWDRNKMERRQNRREGLLLVKVANIPHNQNCQVWQAGEWILREFWLYASLSKGHSKILHYKSMRQWSHLKKTPEWMDVRERRRGERKEVGSPSLWIIFGRFTITRYMFVCFFFPARNISLYKSRKAGKLHNLFSTSVCSLLSTKQHALIIFPYSLLFSTNFT